MDLSRRSVLRLGALGTAGLAGCSSDRKPAGQRVSGGGGGSTGTPTGTDSPTPTSHPLPAPEDLCSADPTIDSDDPLLVDIDARAQFRCAGEPMENFETLEDWTVQSGSLAADENVVYSGTQSARVEVGPGERRARINRRFPNGIDLSAHHLSIAVKLDTPATQSVSVRLDAPDHENVLLMGDYIWRAGWMRIDLGPWKEIGSPDLTDVRDLSIQLYTGGGSEARFHVDSLRRHPRPETGRVVLTFINSFESQYEQVFPALRERGLQGVVSAIPETTEWDRKITMEGLREMHDAGWDVVSSPWRGKHFRVLEPPEQETRIRESKRWLVDNGLVRGSDVLVWPAGRYDRTSLRIASRYHRLGFVGGRGPAGTLTGPLVVGRVSGMDREALEQAVDFAAKYDQVLPLSYRAVGNMFSGIAKKTFLEGLDYALDSGLEVVTATELLATMGDAVESD